MTEEKCMSRSEFILPEINDCRDEGRNITSTVYDEKFVDDDGYLRFFRPE